MAERDVTKQLPLGYWLKHTDEIITKHVDQVLSDNGFTRFRWQIINIIYEAGAISRKDVFATMKTFIDAYQLDEIVGDFVNKGWLSTAMVRTRDWLLPAQAEPNAKAFSSCKAK